MYQCYIKSHCEAPDFDLEIEANTMNEAIEKFSNITHMSKEKVKPYITELSNCCNWPLDETRVCGGCKEIV